MIISKSEELEDMIDEIIVQAVKQNRTNSETRSQKQLKSRLEKVQGEFNIENIKDFEE